MHLSEGDELGKTVWIERKCLERNIVFTVRPLLLEWLLGQVTS